MPTAAENLRARFDPAWKDRIDLAGLHPLLETALTFIAAPQAMKAEIEAPRTLNAHGVAEALRNKLSKSVVLTCSPGAGLRRRRRWSRRSTGRTSADS